MPARKILLQRGSRELVEERSAALARSMRVRCAMRTKVLSKYRFYLKPSDRSITPHLAVSRCWESWVSIALARRVRPDMTCLISGPTWGTTP
jgi:hypothetical protein